jgi:hypothetical protein
MKRYFVEHVVDTPMSIGDRHQHQVGPRAIVYNIPNRNATIHIFDSLSAHKRYGITTSKGLGVHMHLDAADLDDAVRTAKDITEVLLSTLAFASLSECPPAQWRRAYEVTSGLTVREYRQYFNYHVPGTMQQIANEIYTGVFKSIDPLPDERIIRAMTWFRLGLSQDNVYDELIYYWSALENLDGLLKGVLTKRCSEKEPRLGKGMLRFFVTSLGYKTDDYWVLKNTRNDVIHGLVPLSRDLTQKIRNQLPELRRSCIAALCFLLEIESVIEDRIADQIIARGEPFSGHMEVCIDLPSVPPLNQIGQHPWLEFPPNNLTLAVKEDGSLDVKLDVKIGKTVVRNAKILGDKIDFAIYGAERRGDAKVTHKKANGTVTPLTPRTETQ